MTTMATSGVTGTASRATVTVRPNVSMAGKPGPGAILKPGPSAGAGTGPASSPLSGRRAAARRVLSTVERLVFRGDAMDVARANAWAAVLSDRERARQRAEAEAALDAQDARG